MKKYIVATLLFAFILENLVVLGLRWDLNKSEWASWVQAVGSIAAIVGAIWLAGDQGRKQARARKQGATRQARSCCDDASATCTEVLNDIRSIGGQAPTDEKRKQVLLTLQGAFRAIGADFSAIQMADLAPGDFTAVAIAKRRCRTMELTFGALILDPPNQNLQNIIDILQIHAPHIDQIAEGLRHSHANVGNA